jgi:SAM-dependent methyltransferase
MDEREEEPTSEPAYWDRLYREDRAGWDLGGPAPPFVALLDAPGAPPPGRLISLGAGRGHDALFFAERGFDVVGVDFAQAAVEAAEEMARSRQPAGSIRFEQRDIFALPAAYSGAFDYVLEHTCLAAMDQARRGDYAQLVRRLLRPGGTYIAIFFNHGRAGGPPFSIDEPEIRAMFEGLLEIERLGRPERAHPRREGQELFGVFRRPSPGD